MTPIKATIIEDVIAEELATAALIADLDGSRDWTTDELARINSADIECQTLARAVPTSQWLVLQEAMLAQRRAILAFGLRRLQHIAQQQGEQRRIDHCAVVAGACRVAGTR